MRTAIIFKYFDRWLVRPQSSKSCERNKERKGKKLIWSVFSQIRSFVKNASNPLIFFIFGKFPRYSVRKTISFATNVEGKRYFRGPKCGSRWTTFVQCAPQQLVTEMTWTSGSRHDYARQEVVWAGWGSGPGLGSPKKPGRSCALHLKFDFRHQLSRSSSNWSVSSLSNFLLGDIPLDFVQPKAAVAVVSGQYIWK